MGWVRRYGVLAAGAGVLGVFAAARAIQTESSERSEIPFPDARPALSRPADPPPTAPPEAPSAAGVVRPDSPAAASAPPAPRWNPTPRMAEILAALDGPIFRPDLLASVARHLHQERPALEADRLLEPTQFLRDALAEGRPLADSIGALLERFGGDGRGALERQLQFQHRRAAEKLERDGEDASKARRHRERLALLEEFGVELARSIGQP
jgi:hypothetical protein